MKMYCIMYGVLKDGSRYYVISTVKEEYAENQKMKGVDMMGNPKYCYKMIDAETAARLRKLKVSEWGIELPERRMENES